ncbi:MAG: PIG-L deacetylase family protein [Spartobacteria bacterium]
MNLSQASHSIHIPDGLPEEAALSRVTHLGIGAHQDDLEFMAFHGIVACYDSDNRWFAGVTCTNGAGSSRTGAFAEHTDLQMQEVRRKEQNLAADIGHYAAMIQLDHSSAAVKNRQDTALRDDLLEILRHTRPRTVYTHNLADKHETHVGVALATVEAVRLLPPELRPRPVIGCEVWRGLDWMDDRSKVVMDVSGHDELAARLNGVFASQIAGGKRYDLAIMGRRAANATFFQSHATDRATQIIFGMDLTPLVVDPSLDITSYVAGFANALVEDVREKLERGHTA